MYYFVQTVEAVHPHPYHDISKDDFYTLRDQTIAAFADSMTAVAAWPHFAKLAAAINEGHTDMRLPAAFGEEAAKGNILFLPVVVSRALPAGLLVRAGLSGDSMLQAGDTIQSINGMKADAIIDLLSSGVGGLQSWREQQVLRDFMAQLYLHGIRAPYMVQFKRGEDVFTKEAKALTLVQLQQNIAALHKPTPPQAPYSFVRLNHNIGYLNFTTMAVPLEAFTQFLDSVFRSIKKTGLNGLVIDLRKNGGGNSMLGFHLIHYISNKPFRMAAGSEWKVSAAYKEQMRANNKPEALQNNQQLKRYLSMPDGELLVSDAGRAQTSGKNPLRYKGKVVVLIGPQTFSSANMTANAIQDYRLATLIGEPTGEPANDYGELYQSRLHNTGIGFVTSTKKFIRANGNKEDTNPVLPEITIVQNPASEKDNVLDFAVHWLRRQKR